MKIETLKKSHLKRNIIVGVVVVLIISAIILNFTKAKYRVTQSIPLVNGTINYSLPDLNIVAITVDGESVDTIPDGNYELTEESYCTVNGEKDSNTKISYDSNTKTLNVMPFKTKGTKWYLDFTKVNSAVETILENVIINNGIPDFSQVAITDEGVYAAEDNVGTSYYFRGAVENNYVYFARYYWRIIRINGDGTIRIIYNGNTTSTAGTLINNGTQYRFNNNYNRSEYVGLKYTLGQQHGQATNSSIFDILQSWYTDSGLSATQYSQYIDKNVGFCSDRNMANGFSWSSQPNSTIRYAAYERLNTNKIPSLMCSNNDVLKIAVGLITADETVLAGGVYRKENKHYYLYTEDGNYWTMTPVQFTGTESYTLNIGSPLDINGEIYSINVNAYSGVRPVINLRADIELTGSGTATDPYQLVM